MALNSDEKFISDVSGKEFPILQLISGSTVRESMVEFIRRDYPGFNDTSKLSLAELNSYREKYIAEYLLKEVTLLSDLERNALATLTERSTLTDKLDKEEDESKLSRGQRVADRVADFGGSWVFILSFMGFLVIWIIVNAFFLSQRAFDPFPFILLNLILSCLAALQAPIIMMSQNRQEEKDRERSKKDYMINLKSELEIRILHEKIDHLIMHQQQELMEIQKVQIEIMHDILNRVEQSQEKK
jgi:uncharacterized membrane protein